MQIALVFAGGGIGSVLRYLIGVALRNTGISLPLATFASNITACVIFAAFVHFAGGRITTTGDMKLFVLTGICGGLSTFSTFGFETFMLFQQGMVMWAVLNILISVVFCLLLFYLIK